MNRPKSVVLAAIAVVLASGDLFATTFTTLNDPLAVANGIQVTGISGGNIVGEYVDGSDVFHGFLYNGSTYTPLDDPLAGSSNGKGQGTDAIGISGGSIVGLYEDSSDKVHGFLFNGSTYTTLNDPLSNGYTVATGISGSDVVGFYNDESGTTHGFLYNGSTYTTLNDPLAGLNGMLANGISGNNIVGYYSDSMNHEHGFLYDGSSYTTLNGSVSGSDFIAYGIDGSNIVGWGGASNPSIAISGFAYDGSTYTEFDYPGAVSTYAYAISGNTIVGNYESSSGQELGFVATVPEPSSLVLFGFAALGLAVAAQRRKMGQKVRTI